MRRNHVRMRRRDPIRYRGVDKNKTDINTNTENTRVQNHNIVE